MIAKEVESKLAKIMYYGVYRFGPRWVVDKNFVCPPGIACELTNQTPTHIREIKVTPVFNEKEFAETAHAIEADNMSLNKIRIAADQSFFGENAEFDIKGEVSRGDRLLMINERNRLSEVQKDWLRGSLASYLKSP
jgi:hypothetical protein